MILEKAKAIDGWMADKELEFLAKEAQKAQRIIEVGSFYGRSTRALADNTPGTVWAVDPWSGPVYNEDGGIAFVSGPEVMQIFYMNMMNHVKSGKVIMCPTKFCDWEGLNHPDVFETDFVFLDGDHRYEEVISDINNALKFKPKVLAGHDYADFWWPGVKKAVDELFGDDIEVVDTIWIKRLR